METISNDDMGRIIRQWSKYSFIYPFTILIYFSRVCKCKLKFLNGDIYEHIQAVEQTEFSVMFFSMN